MKKLHLTTAMSLLAFALSGNLSAQDTNTDNHTVTISVPEVALVDVEPAAAKNITLALKAPSDAGNSLLASDMDNTLWLNYSSIKSDADPTRNVSVKMNAIIPGVDVRVMTSGASGTNSGGTLGAATYILTLSNADQTVISGIGSAYTGNGANNGHSLGYFLVPSNGTDYANLTATASHVATVTYTMSDN